MLNFKTTGRFLSVTALAASTALSFPLAAFAQDAQPAPPQIQDAPPEVAAPEAPAPEAAPAPEPQAEPAPAPEPEAAPPPEAAPEPQAPAAEPAPAPADTPPADQAPAPQGEAPAEIQSAPDSGPPVGAPEGNPANLPTDAGTQNDLGEAPAADAPPAPEPVPDAPAAPAQSATPAAPAPSAEPAPPAEPAPTPPPAAGEQPAAPPTPTTPSPIPPAAPSSGAEPTAPSTAPADPAAPAAPSTPPTAPVDPSAPPVAPGAAPVVPGTPAAPAAPGTPAPVDPATPAPTSPAPASPAPGAPPAAATPGAAAPGAAAPGAPAPQAAAPQVPEAPRPVAADIQTAPVAQGQIGQNDARVQTLAQPVEIRPVTAEQGQRMQAAPQVVLPPNVQVVETVGNREILSLVGAGVAGAAAGGLAAYFIRSNDNERLARGSRDVTFEQLPRGLTRETIVRPNGVQVVTIENEFGDVIQRSRIMPDGREVVLFYDPYAEDTQRPDYYTDAGADLPPLQLEIPEDRYIVDVSEPDEELYYDTIVAPPVETVERIYSLDEVRRSPRIRDKVRRIDLNTITFGFGSASIEQAEVNNLQALADAVKRVIDDNPSEVFLLEGHTDAVGSNVANLALSDQRAEAVASALTEFFEIPSENIVTQGYGEEDLKVDTPSENRENRRVTLRRITPLVKPVVSAQAN